MSLTNRLKALFLFIGDVALLYAALFLTLLIRYGSEGFYREFVNTHVTPFTVIFVPWLAIFYISGLYDLRRLRNNIDFLKTLALSLITNAIIASLVFYLVPAFGITPKTNLFIFIIVFAVIEGLWRRFFNLATVSGEAPNRVLIVGSGATTEEIAATLFTNRQMGYEIVCRLNEDEADQNPAMLREALKAHGANFVVVPRELKRKSTLAPVLYSLFGRGVPIMDLDSFYELILRKIPLSDVQETWFIENIEGASKFYDPFKRAIEFLFALALGIVLIPVELAIAILVLATSRGPVLYKQVRVGARGREFVFYKFRSMRIDAEAAGAQWSPGAEDPRVTPLGRVLRASHLDELPQLWNIFKGDLSFVGPRPERPEFISKLKAQIPFYEVRLLIKPGVTGWAQIHHRSDRTEDDVKEKLQYDIYYLKNRSPILDLAIILKTVKTIVSTPQ